jgi:xanthine/uracil permease
VVAITKAETAAAATGAMLIGGLFLVAVSPVIAKLRPLFPPLVVGALLVLTGFTLLKIAMGVAFGMNTPYFGQPVTVAFLMASIVAITIIATLPNPLVRSLSILITLVMGYIASLAVSASNLSAIVDASPGRIRPGW